MYRLPAIFLVGLILAPGLAAAEPAEQPDPIPQGTLEREEITGVITADLSAIRGCYARRLVHAPELEGSLVIKFVIAPDGAVTEASVKETSTLRDSELETCILQRFKTMQFPEPEGNGEVRVSYPFKFAPDAKAAPTR